MHGTPAAQADYDAWEVKLISQIDLTRRGRRAFRAMNEVVPYEIFRAAREAAADDGRRTVAIVRGRAREWDLGPGRIGMIGFSAGAFLVADVAVDPRAAPLAFVAPSMEATRRDGRCRQTPRRSSPSSLPFLGWRGALSDEDWVGLGGLQRDADYFERVFTDTGVDLRST